MKELYLVEITRRYEVLVYVEGKDYAARMADKSADDNCAFDDDGNERIEVTEIKDIAKLQSAVPKNLFADPPLNDGRLPLEHAKLEPERLLLIIAEERRLEEIRADLERRQKKLF